MKKKLTKLHEVHSHGMSSHNTSEVNS